VTGHGGARGGRGAAQTKEGWKMARRVAVVLSGCGVFDGSEIHEAVLTLLALDQAGAQYQCCAPNADQMHVVDHLAGKPTDEKRNILTESARIARGSIKNLAQIRADDFDALVIPGGFGAAKNLCNYAVAGQGAVPNPEVGRVIREFAAQRKPIGAICIAPALMAAAFRDDKDARPTLTIGTDAATAADIEAMGATHAPCSVKDFVVDQKNRIVTTPAYMLGKGPAEVFIGIEKLVKALLDMCGGR
jgi:enhancing lycopene biosynthesis protein 2